MRYITSKLICNLGKDDIELAGIIAHNDRIVFVSIDHGFFSINFGKSDNAIFIANVMNGDQFGISNDIFKIILMTGKIHEQTEEALLRDSKYVSDNIVDVLNGELKTPVELCISE